MINITYIYLVENCYEDPNKVYIGKTKNKTRELNHRKRFGENIIFTIIDQVKSLDKKEWEPLETYWIHQFRQWGFILLNKNEGGGGPVSWTEEQKQKRKKPRPKEWGLHQSLIKKGKPNLKLKGQKYNVKHVLQYDLNKNFIKEWNSLTEVKQKLGIDPQHVLINKNKTAGGFVWKYK